MTPSLSGACHCRRVRFRVDWHPEEMTTCDCSLCAMRNALMVKVPDFTLHVEQGAELLTLYEWNSRVAKHYFCSLCGIYVFHRKRAAPDHFGVNVFCLADWDRGALPIRATDGRGMSLVSDP